jgi:hypothetical protein
MASKNFSGRGKMLLLPPPHRYATGRNGVQVKYVVCNLVGYLYSTIVVFKKIKIINIICLIS